MAMKAILFLLFSLLFVSTRVSSIEEKFETTENYGKHAPAPPPEWVDLPPKKAPASPPKPPTTVYPPPSVKPPAHPPPKPPVKPPPPPTPKPPTPAPKPPVYPPPQKPPPLPPVLYGCSHKCLYYCKKKRPRRPIRFCHKVCTLCCRKYQCVPGLQPKCGHWDYVKDKSGYKLKCP